MTIISIQEAGLDGFWLHRWLGQHGVDSHVVDAASIAAPRRKRRAKSDGIDGETLLRVLAAWRRGEPRVCSMVAPPSVEAEDQRRLTREHERLLAERVALTNRIGGLLIGQGVHGYEPLRQDRRAALAARRTGDGRALPRHLRAEIERMLERLELLLAQIAAVKAERAALLKQRQAEEGSAVALLLRLCGIGPGFASVLWLECLGRDFANRRQLASFAGLAPTPWRSGGIVREQGVRGRRPAAAAQQHGRTGLALAAPPAGLGAEPVVPCPHRRRLDAAAAHRHRGAGAQAAGGAVALCQRRRGAGGGGAEGGLRGAAMPIARRPAAPSPMPARAPPPTTRFGRA